MFDTFIESLDLPPQSRIERKLHKKQFYELSGMNRSAQERFSRPIESITWTHSLQRSTINIPPLVTEHLEYIEIAYIHVKLREKTPVNKLSEVIHRIPYPVVLFITCQDELCISLALKRINLADPSRLTVEEYIHSDWIDLRHPTEHDREFLESIRTDRLSFENFYRFYQDIVDRIVAYEASALSGEFSLSRTPQRKQTLDRIKAFQEEIDRLKNQIKKETQFNTRVDLNISIKKLSDQIDQLKQELL